MPLDDTGYSAPSTEELVNNMATTAQSEFGPLIDTSANSVLGHLIGVTAIEISRVSEDLQELNSNLNRNTSEGRMLENLGLLGGFTRKGKAFTTGTVVFTGPVSTVIPQGTVLYVLGDATRRFLTTADNTIGSSGTVLARVKAEVAGAIQAPIGQLTEFDVEIVGVTVTNPYGFSVGTDEVETEAQFRNRINNSLSIGGNGTVQALYASLFQLAGTTAVKIVNNPTHLYVPRGNSPYPLPPNSFEVIIEGGSEEEIVETIALVKSMTSESFGTYTAMYTGYNGDQHQIRFTRPESVEVNVNVSYRLYNEEIFPLDGEARMLEAIQEFAETEYELGKDVLVDRLIGPCFSVAGIANVDITVGTGITLTGDDISIELYEKAVLSSITFTRTY